MNTKFIKFEKNNDTDAKFLGIATISVFDGKLVIRFKVNHGKNGGTYCQPMTCKQNDEWISAFTIDSNIATEEINSLIKKGMQGNIQVNENPKVVEPQKKPQQMTFDDSTCPF